VQFKLPGPLSDTIAMLADAASPTALFTIGAVLARSALLSRDHARQFPDAPHHGLSRVGNVLPVVIVKLVMHPLLVYTVARGAMALGLPLNPIALLAIVLVAALPSASNVAMLAERFGADNGRIARIILWTTVAAFFTFPLAVAWIR
jgi:malonate transporter